MPDEPVNDIDTPASAPDEQPAVAGTPSESESSAQLTFGPDEAPERVADIAPEPEQPLAGMTPGPAAETAPGPASAAETAPGPAPGAPELDAIRAELEGSGGEAAADAEEVAVGDLADEVAATRTEGEQTAEELASEVPVGEDAEAVETWLEKEPEGGLGRNRAMSVPFFAYLGIWFVFSVTMVVMLKDVAKAGSPVYAESYGIFVFLAIALTVLGPLMALVVWLLSRYWTERGERRGLLALALLRGAISTFAGVAMWTLALYVLDLFKTGVLK